MIAPNNEIEPEPQGGGGALFARVDNLRSDARLVARMISLGVVDVEKAEELLRDAFLLAQGCKEKNKARDWAAVAKIIIECAKLGQNERHKLLDKIVADKHDHLLTSADDERAALDTVLSEPDYVEFLRNATLQEDSDSGLVCQISESGHSSPLENGASHGPTGPGTNGHRNGSE